MPLLTSSNTKYEKGGFHKGQSPFGGGLGGTPQLLPIPRRMGVTPDLPCKRGPKRAERAIFGVMEKISTQSSAGGLGGKQGMSWTTQVVNNLLKLSDPGV